MEEDTKKQPDGSFKYYRFNRFYALIVVAAILAALILFVLLALCVSPQRSPLADYEWSASDKYDAELYPTLTVAPDGRFKIMQVSDLHILSGASYGSGLFTFFYSGVAHFLFLCEVQG